MNTSKIIITYIQFSLNDKIVAYDYEDGWWCNCEDHHFRKHECKHIKHAKRLSKNLVIDENISYIQFRLGKYDQVQYDNIIGWKCKTCISKDCRHIQQCKEQLSELTLLEKVYVEQGQTTLEV